MYFMSFFLLFSSKIEERRRLGLVRLSVADEEYLRLKREIDVDEEQDRLRIARINTCVSTVIGNTLEINIDDIENMSPLKTRRPAF